MMDLVNAGKRAYRGYMIVVTICGQVIVEKDGVVICRPASVDDAKKQIDQLVLGGA